MDLELVKVTMHLILGSVPAYEERKSIQESTLKMLNQKIGLGTWHHLGTHPFEDIKTDLYYQLNLRKPYALEKFNYSIFNDFKQIGKTRINSVEYIFEAEDEYSPEYYDQTRGKVLDHIRQKHKTLNCFRGFMYGGQDSMTFGIECSKKESWEYIECPECHSKVKKLKHYGATKCEKCNTPILCF